MEGRSDVSGGNSSWVGQGSIASLQLENRQKPQVRGPNDVSIKVKACSVNPIDIKVCEGYGKVLFSWARKLKAHGLSSIFTGTQPEHIPSIQGRDFSGTVEAVGESVQKFKPGDEVFGATSPLCDGSHAHYTLATDSDICKKPDNVSDIEAASIPYVALTFLSAFHAVGGTCDNMKGKRVHLNAAAGGVGSFATQYLKAVGCEVTVSVSKSAAEVVAQFNPDHVLDYQAPNYQKELQKVTGFDIAFDFAGDESAMSHVKPGGYFVTLIAPMIRSMDSIGLVLGGLYATALMLSKKVQVRYSHGIYYTTAMFTTNQQALEQVKTWVEEGKIKPVVERVFPFRETPAAYEKVSQGKGRGKVVIDVIGRE